MEISIVKKQQHSNTKQVAFKSLLAFYKYEYSQLHKTIDISIFLLRYKVFFFYFIL